MQLVGKGVREVGHDGGVKHDRLKKTPAFIVALLVAGLSGCQTTSVGPNDSRIGEDFLPNDISSVPTSQAPEVPRVEDYSNAAQSSTIVPGRDRRLAPLRSDKTTTWQKKGGDIVLNFSNISVEDAAQLILGDQLGKAFSVDADVTGRLSLNGQGGLHSDDLIPTFKVLLGTVDAKLVQEGDRYRIVKGADQRRVHSNKNLDIVPLNYISAEDFSRVLANHGINAAVIDDGNLVAVNAPTETLRKIRGLANTFDVNWFKHQSIGFFPIENAAAEQLSDQLIALLGDKKSARIGSLRIVPVKRSNSVMVVAPSEAAVQEVGRWIAQLDQQNGAATQGFYVYRVKNGKAKDLAKLASDIFNANQTDSQFDDAESQEPQRGGKSFVSSTPSSDSLRIIADEATNSVVVSGSPYHFKLVKEAMKQLDTKPLQVLVEARIMELSLTGELQYGLEWFLQGSRASSDTNGSLDFNRLGPDLQVPGFNYVIERAGEIRGILNAFADDSRLKVLSSPSLLVLNNRTARIQVGDEVPIPRIQSVSNFAPDAPTVNAIEYRDTGIVLQVTPRINEGGMVTLDVSQEVSSVGRNTVSDIDAPIIQQRKLSSTIAVENGQTVVLGGLIQERESTGVSGVPLLKSIPGVGKLFSNTSNNSRRTELIALLTPKVVERREDIAKINQDYIESFRGLREIKLAD